MTDDGSMVLQTVVSALAVVGLIVLGLVLYVKWLRTRGPDREMWVGKYRVTAERGFCKTHVAVDLILGTVCGPETMYEERVSGKRLSHRALPDDEADALFDRIVADLETER